MDPRLIQYYERELRHLRAMGGEFAQQFPKIAARLSMNELEVADPYVERLLEGVAFLAARVQLKLDAEFPRFTQALLEIIYPHYLSPTPAMLVAQFVPDPGDPGLATGFKRVPRGSTVSGAVGGEVATSCEFRTAQDVILWPCRVSSASYFSYAPDLQLNTLPVASRIKGGVRLRLTATAGLKFAQTAIDKLRFFIAGDDAVASKLYELCSGSALGALVVGKKGAAPEFIAREHLRPTGFSDDEALLPVTLRSFHGYRLLQEYFAFPQRYRFLEISGLQGAIKRATGDEIELVICSVVATQHSKASSMVRTSRCTARPRSTCSRNAPIGSRWRAGRLNFRWWSTARGRWISKYTKSPKWSGTAAEIAPINRSSRFTRRTVLTNANAMRRTSRPAASHAYHRARKSVAAHVRVTSAPRCFCRWLIRRRRRSAGICASSPSRQPAPIVISSCRCR
jgi:hypothetical protein